MLIVKAKIKGYAKDFNVSGDVAEALDKKAIELVSDAVERAKDNQRKTVMAKDIPHYFVCSKNAPEMIIVRAKVKEYAKGMNVAGDLAEGLNFVVADVIRKAGDRAKENQRRTLMAKDL